MVLYNEESMSRGRSGTRVEEDSKDVIIDELSGGDREEGIGNRGLRWSECNGRYSEVRSCGAEEERSQ